MLTDLVNLLSEMAAVSSLTEHLFVIGDLFISKMLCIWWYSFSAQRKEIPRCLRAQRLSSASQICDLMYYNCATHTVL